MSIISASDVSKLRKITGAGIMDCKRALEESGGNFENAVDIIRKRGQLVADKRSEREAAEGVVLAKVAGKNGVMICLNCETDFVAKNVDFVKLAESIVDLAIEKLPANLDELKNLKIDSKPIVDIITQQMGITGEKMELSYYGILSCSCCTIYSKIKNWLLSLALIKTCNTDRKRYSNADSSYGSRSY